MILVHTRDYPGLTHATCLYQDIAVTLMPYLPVNCQVRQDFRSPSQYSLKTPHLQHSFHLSKAGIDSRYSTHAIRSHVHLAKTLVCSSNS